MGCQYLSENRPTYKDITALNPINEITRSCHICMKPTKNLDYTICDECREAILFIKELKKSMEVILKK